MRASNAAHTEPPAAPTFAKGVNGDDARVAVLSNLLVDEIFKTLGLSQTGLFRRLGGRMFRRPTRRLSQIGLQLDDLISSTSLNDALGVFLTEFAHPLWVDGVRNVPRQGPLVVAPNHPGTVDSLAVLASLPRTDVKIIAGYTPILESLVHLREHLIFRELTGTNSRVSAVRAALRHLEEGGCLLLFPAGRLEPDPAVLPGAASSLSSWHRSIELFLRKVPNTAMVPVIVSHILLPRFVNHVLAASRRSAADRQRTAEMLQILSQVVRRNRYVLSPRISFGEMCNYQELEQQHADQPPFEAIITQFKELLSAHVAHFEHDYPPLEVQTV